MVNSKTYAKSLQSTVSKRIFRKQRRGVIGYHQLRDALTVAHAKVGGVADEFDGRGDQRVEFKLPSPTGKVVENVARLREVLHRCDIEYLDIALLDFEPRCGGRDSMVQPRRL